MCQQPAKTPAVAVARVLRSLGLRQGSDFRVKGTYEKGERIGTRVVPLTSYAEQVIKDHADHIEDQTDLSGFPFQVSVYLSPSGRTWTWTDNYGHRHRPDAYTTAR